MATPANVAIAGATLALTGHGSILSGTTGSFSFANVNAGSYTLTISKAGYVFTPASRAVTVTTANVANACHPRPVPRSRVWFSARGQGKDG